MKKQKTKTNTIYVILILLIFSLLGLAYLLISNPYALHQTQAFFLDQNDDYSISLNKSLKLEAYSLSNSAWQEDQSLLLVNQSHPLPQGFVADLGEYKDSTVFMNTTLLENYAELSNAVTLETGSKMYVSSVFRSVEEQAEIYNADPMIALPPGYSEHHTGLALDVYVENYAGPNFIQSPAGQFVDQHGPEFGFVIRYPENKEDITGIPYEPWHIRYVGLPHSMIMAKHYWTLEEYIQFLEPGAVYQSNEYVISRQNPQEDIYLPKNLSEITYSADNTGYIIITGILD